MYNTHIYPPCKSCERERMGVAGRVGAARALEFPPSESGLGNSQVSREFQ